MAVGVADVPGFCRQQLTIDLSKESFSRNTFVLSLGPGQLLLTDEVQISVFGPQKVRGDL